MRKSVIVRHGKGILKQLECIAAAGRFVVYGQHVEAPLARGWHLAQEVARDQPEFALFVAIHGGFGGLYVTRGAGFHLNKTQRVFVPSDQIQFTAMMWRTIIPRD